MTHVKRNPSPNSHINRRSFGSVPQDHGQAGSVY